MPRRRPRKLRMTEWRIVEKSIEDCKRVLLTQHRFPANEVVIDGKIPCRFKPEGHPYGIKLETEHTETFFLFPLTQRICVKHLRTCLELAFEASTTDESNDIQLLVAFPNDANKPSLFARKLLAEWPEDEKARILLTVAENMPDIAKALLKRPKRYVSV
jgi:hypothetical protein